MLERNRPPHPLACLAVCCSVSVGLLSCAGPEATNDVEPSAAGSGSAPAPARAASNAIVELLDQGLAVFGVFSGERTAEQGARMAELDETDFVFYSLEQGPFDIPTMEVYLDALRGGGADPASPHPFILRVPPAGEGEAALREHVAQALDAGVQGIVFPHAHGAADVELAVGAMRFAGADGSPPGTRPEAVGRAPAVWGLSEGEYRQAADVWPVAGNGRLVAMMIVEDREGLEHVDEIAAAPGVGVLFAGPGDFRRAFDGDMERVEAAIQTVLAACRTHDVPCGITAGPEDIATRLEQGFRVIIVQELEALAVGRAAAGRTLDDGEGAGDD